MSLPVDEETIERFQQLALESESFCFFLIDEQGIILEVAGETEVFALSDWVIGENILDKALFLHGYLPLTAEYKSIRSFQLSDTCIFDIHLLNDAQGTIILFIDRSKDTEAEARIRQQRNEERLRKRSGE